MIARRGFLKLAGGSLLATLAMGGYAFGVEPQLLTRVKRYALKPPGWPGDLKLRIVALADIHACRPWMPPERIARLVERANALEPDVIVLLGDYVSGTSLVTDWVDADEWAPLLGGLKAPLGVHAVLGNHDWWEDIAAQKAGLARISHTVEVHRGSESGKMLLLQRLTPSRGVPRCKQSVARNGLILELLESAPWWPVSMAGRSLRMPGRCCLG